MEWEFRTRVGFSRQVTGSVKKYDAADLIAPKLMCLHDWTVAQRQTKPLRGHFPWYSIADP